MGSGMPTAHPPPALLGPSPSLPLHSVQPAASEPPPSICDQFFPCPGSVSPQSRPSCSCNPLLTLSLPARTEAQEDRDSGHPSPFRVPEPGTGPASRRDREGPLTRRQRCRGTEVGTVAWSPGSCSTAAGQGVRTPGGPATLPAPVLRASSWCVRRGPWVASGPDVAPSTRDVRTQRVSVRCQGWRRDGGGCSWGWGFPSG